MPLELHVEDMTCAGCVRAVSAAIRELDPDARVEADPQSRKLRVETRAAEPELRAALAAAGFPAR